LVERAEVQSNDWRSGLAFGLIVGIFGASFLYAWLSGGLPGWWKHDGAVVTTKDTLANWLVAIFSFIAAFFLWLTLRATQDMAKDTREVGEAQVRAYIYANVAEIDLAKNTLDMIFKNFGNSPGSISFIDCCVHVSDPYSSRKIWTQSFWSDGWTIAPQDTLREQFRLDAGRAEYLKRMIGEVGIHVCVQGKFQSVDVFKRIHMHGINIVLSDGIIRP
jgi:hypothetical protein